MNPRPTEFTTPKDMHPRTELNTPNPKDQHATSSSNPKTTTEPPKDIHKPAVPDHKPSTPPPQGNQKQPSADHVSFTNSPTPSPSKTMMPRSKGEYVPSAPINIPQYVRWVCEQCYTGHYFPTNQCGSCAHVYCRTCKGYETYDYKRVVVREGMVEEIGYLDGGSVTGWGDM